MVREKKNRVVVTGLGLITPLGNDVHVTWERLLEGKSGIRPIRKWGDLDEIRERYNLPPNFPFMAGEIENLDMEAMMLEPKPEGTRADLKKIKQMDPFIQYACAASLNAVADAGVDLRCVDRDRVGVVIGTGQGGAQTWEEQHVRMLSGKRLSPFFLPRQLANLASGNVSILLGAQGMNLCLTTACAAGAHAIGQAFRSVQMGYNDIVVAGGTEAAVTPLNLYGFHAIKAVAPQSSAPAEASRPFDKSRNGFVMAEGAGIMVLEQLDSAQRRSAKIYTEVLGYGETADAHHITEPNGDGARKCMIRALEDGGISPVDVDLINCHATSTPKGDANEAGAIMSVFGKNNDSPVITANKSQLGHTLGAAGAIEAVLTALSVKTNIVPAILNLDHPSEDCTGLNYVRHMAEENEIAFALSNSFGFGGTNACLAFGKFKE
jgi:3-oxoacyl-[acyl-carrier-protein] synthase II